MAAPVLRKILLVSCDDGQLSINGQSSQHGVRQVIIERFTPPPFLFRYPGTHTGVGNGPIEEPLFKEGLKECLETVRQDPRRRV